MAIALDLMNLSHHAYYMVGGDGMRRTLLKTLEKEHDIELVGDPDFFDRTYETFTIDDARQVKSQAESRPTEAGGRKIFILTMNGITAEAQNALLKLLEEPGEYAHFFLIIPSTHLLLPTIKSRLSFIDAGAKGKGTDVEFAELAEKFLKAPISGRMNIAKDLLDEIAKEKRPKQDVISFLNCLEERLHKDGVRENAKKLESILTARKYATDRAPSLKMLLDYVALNI